MLNVFIDDEVTSEVTLKCLCQNIHRKYEYFENKHCIFWSKHGCFTSLDILNTKRLISPKRKGFRGSILSGLYWELCFVGNVDRLTYLKIGQKGGYVHTEVLCILRHTEVQIICILRHTEVQISRDIKSSEKSLSSYFYLKNIDLFSFQLDDSACGIFYSYNNFIFRKSMNTMKTLQVVTIGKCL